MSHPDGELWMRLPSYTEAPRIWCQFPDDVDERWRLEEVGRITLHQKTYTVDGVELFLYFPSGKDVLQGLSAYIRPTVIGYRERLERDEKKGVRAMHYVYYRQLRPEQ